MGWSFKTQDDKHIQITDDPDKHCPEKGIFYDPDINHDNCGDDRLHPQTNEPVQRLTVQQANALQGITPFEMNLVGPNWPNKQVVMDERRAKALQKNPMHSTMNDYKPENPNSVPAKARKKNLKRLKKKGINVKRR